MLGVLRSSSTLPWLVIGTVGALVAAVFLWRTLRAGTRRDDPLVEGAVLVLATWGLGAAHLPLLIVLNHVRHNEYNVRYFLPVYLFGAISCALAVGLALGLLPRLSRLFPRTLDALGAGALAVGAWSLPAPETSPEFVELQATATRLAQLKPGAPLLGEYWDTYVTSSLQREGALVPIPHEGSYLRTVWLARMMKKYPEVVVDHGDFGAAGSAEAPAPWIFQYGTLLHLEQPRWEHGAGGTYSLYRNVLDASQPHTTTPALTEWDLCTPGTSLTLSFTPRERALVMLALKKASPEVTLSAELLVEGASPTPAPVTLRANDRLFLATLEGGGALLRGVRITASPARSATPPDQLCGAEATFVMDPAMDAAR